jgi:hypothetical protein
LIFMEWRDLPPGGAIRQGHGSPLPMSRSRDGQVGGTQLQHPAAFCRGRRAMAVTGLTIHDNVISP